MATAAPCYDVVVLGAGPAGASCALALARAGLDRLCLVDGGAPAGPAIGETIPPDTRLLLQRLGVWSAFLDEEHLPCNGSCSAWGNARLGFNDFVLNPHGAAWHLDRARFDAFLRGHAQRNGVDVVAGARLADVRQDAGGSSFLLTLASHTHSIRTLRARMLVDATGQAPAGSARAAACWTG